MGSYRILNARLVGESELKVISIHNEQIESVTTLKSADLAPERTHGDDIDAKGGLVLPGLVNAHCHMAMSLFRGYGDDLPLKVWLEERIWPIEAKLKPEDCYYGARLALCEMIRTGTTMVADMYWHPEAVAEALKDSGLRGIVAAPVLTRFTPSPFKDQIEKQMKLFAAGRFGSRVKFSVGPHAPYSVLNEDLAWLGDYCQAHQVIAQIHLAENEWEVHACRKENAGLSPVGLLAKLGLFKARTLAAHAVWLDDEDFKILADTEVTLVHCPTSNMKLCSGGESARAFDYGKAAHYGVEVALGTDGPASNNNLDMFETAKIASLLAKHSSGDPTRLNAKATFDLLTRPFADLWSEKLGIVAPGYGADLIVLAADDTRLNPVHNDYSNLIYTSPGSAVRATICQGKVLMRNGEIAERSALIREVESIAARLSGKA